MKKGKTILLFSFFGIMTMLFSNKGFADISPKQYCEAHNDPTTEVKKQYKFPPCVYSPKENEPSCKMTPRYDQAYKKIVDCAYNNCDCGSSLSKDDKCKTKEHKACVQEACLEEAQSLAQFGKTIQELTACVEQKNE